MNVNSVGNGIIVVNAGFSIVAEAIGEPFIYLLHGISEANGCVVAQRLLSSDLTFVTCGSATV